MNNYLNIHTLLIVIAVVIFVLAAINVSSRLHLVALGLAVFALAFLAGCQSVARASRENFESVDFKASYGGAGVGTRVRLREPARTGYEK